VFFSVLKKIVQGFIDATMKRSTRRTPAMILRRAMTGEPSDISVVGVDFQTLELTLSYINTFPAIEHCCSHLIPAA